MGLGWSEGGRMGIRCSEGGMSMRWSDGGSMDMRCEQDVGTIILYHTVCTAMKSLRKDHTPVVSIEGLADDKSDKLWLTVRFCGNDPIIL